MLAASCFSTVLLRSDGTAVGCGYNFNRWNIPPAKEGLTYTQVATGFLHTLLLQSDGTAIAWGDNRLATCVIPVLEDGLGPYTQVAAGAWHSVLLRRDGMAEAWCHIKDEQYRLPGLSGDVTYTYVAAGVVGTVLIRSDGAVLIHTRYTAALGSGRSWETRLLVHPKQVPACTQAAVGETSVVLLREDGTAVVLPIPAQSCDLCVLNRSGQYTVPALEAGAKYTQVAAGAHHTVLLRSDGRVVTSGDNQHGQCNIPSLDAGLSYTDVAAGSNHTVLLRSDGTAVACGDNESRQCSLPVLEGDLSFGLLSFVLQASFEGDWVAFRSCSGRVMCQLKAANIDSLEELRAELASYLGRVCTRVDVVFPAGELLSKLLREDPTATLGLLRRAVHEPPCKKAKGTTEV